MRKYGFPILLVCLMMSQLIRIPTDLVSFKQVAVVPSDVALAALGGFAILRKLRYSRLFFQSAFLALPIFLFAAVGALSLWVNAQYYDLPSHELNVSSLYFARWLLYTLPYFLVLDLLGSREHVKTLFKIVAAAVGGFAVFGISQAILLPNFAQMLDPENIAGWDVQYHRLVSSFLDPNLAACLLGMALATSIAFWLEGQRRAWIPTIVFGVGLLLTYSRGGILAFCAGFLYLTVTGKYKRRVLAATLLMGLMVVILTPYFLPHAEAYGKFGISDFSAQNRIANWRIEADMIRDNTFFGIGFNTFPFVAHHYGLQPQGGTAFGLDGGLLWVFSLTGIFGIAAFSLILGRAMWMGHHVLTQSKDWLYRGLARSSIAAILVIVTSSFFTSSLFYPYMMAIVWVHLGLVNVGYNVLRKAERNELAALSTAKRNLLARPQIAAGQFVRTGIHDRENRWPPAPPNPAQRLRQV